MRRRVCTCRLGSPPPASYPLEDGFFALSRFCIADHGPPKMPGAVQTCGIASSRRALSPYPIFIAPGFILFSEVGRIRSAGFSWINLTDSRPFGGGLVRSCLCLCVFAFYDKASTHPLFTHIDILICAHSLLYTYAYYVLRHVRLIQQKPALRSHPLSEKSMNPGAIKIG